MVDSTDDGDILCLSGVPEVGTVQDPGGEVFGTTIRALYRSKLGCYPLVGTVLSGGDFEVDMDSNLEDDSEELEVSKNGDSLVSEGNLG